MIVITGRNVNDLYHRGRIIMDKEGVFDKSRDGDVLVMPCPVMSVYERPRERVLFDAKRDANPFFHLLESLWMLAGRQDAKFLQDYIKDFDRFAEANGLIHGAYGYRWRNWFGQDQLDTIVERLRANHKDRRVVLQMWDSDNDLRTLEMNMPNDLPCNTHCYFRIVNGRLDMTIMCRSNDIVWGAYGANAVHFSVLQEYIAAGIGVPVGLMYQLSNNYHLYVGRVKGFDPPEYNFDGKWIAPLVNDYDSFEDEVVAFCDGKQGGFQNQFFNTVAEPMRACALAWRKDGAAAARVLTYAIQDDPWRDAAEAWLNRRLRNES